MPAAPPSCALHRIESGAGTAVWRALDWDSAQFGFAAARLEQLQPAGSDEELPATMRALLQVALEDCHAAGVRYLTARVAVADLPFIHALEGSGFELIDGIQTLSMPLGGKNFSMPAGVRLFEPDDLEAVLEIARSAFVYDRFHADASLPRGAGDRVNEAWTQNCCLGSAADAVIVAEEQGRVANYVACRLCREDSLGVIVLVATAPWAQGRGLARRATGGALHWLALRGAAMVEVGTQLGNVPAARLYQSMGFRLARTSLTFRKLL